ncbi:MAG: molybdopterin-dependent oxidoreductase [Acidimicrobiia bacterium]|nr:molybdopterin-dependent oxidoreductase [Acidimicrobiia bacterium]
MSMSTSSTPPHFTPESRRRREDLRFITGVGRYVADLSPSATLHVAFVRSIEPHARITTLEIDDAVNAPGVVAVYTAADLDLPHIPGDNLATKAPDFPRPHLAHDTVRYVGEPLAAVVADSPAHAADAVDLVWVDYDPIPVVADPESALKDESVLHPQAGTNVVERWELGEAAGTAAHDVTIKIKVENQRVAPVSIEPLVILAEPAPDGRLSVNVSHQRPHEFRAKLAGFLGVDPQKIRVVVPDVGGAFGMKGMTYPEYSIIPAIALQLDKPVLWVERRREHLSGGTHGRGSSHRVRLSGRSGGRIERAEIHIVGDMGAYPHNGGAIPSFSRYVAPGLYDIPDIWITSSSVVTNRAPTGSYRGAGRPEAAYAIERAIDAFAREADLDPVAVRMTNFISDLPFRTPTGALYDSGDYRAALELAVGLVDLEAVRSHQSERRNEGGDPIGIGFGAFVERAGGRVDTGEYGKVEVDDEGKVIVRTGSMSAGQGHETVWAQVAAEALGVTPEDVEFVAGDTDNVDRGTGTSASRSTQIGASAVWRTAHEVRRTATQVAADLLEASQDDIALAGGEFSVVGVPDSGIPWADVAKEAARRRIELSADEWYVPGAQTFPYGVHVAVVEVSLETGEVRVEKLVTVDDCGRVLNPMLVEGQIQGSAMQGIGQALYEGIDYSDDGQLRTSSLMDYSMPRAGDAPPIIPGRVVSPAPSNSLGAKGTGEAGCIGVPPAIVNATLNALAPYGVTHLDMPLHPAKVWDALHKAGLILS